MISDYEMNKLLDEKYQKYLGTSLKQLRTGWVKKVTQKDMAQKLHVDRQRIISLEQGDVRATVPELICYSRTFNCPIESILFHNEYEDYFNGDIQDDRWKDI